MQRIYSHRRWDNPGHKSAVNSDEHLKLEHLERTTGHRWERTYAGEVKFFRLEHHCQGPECARCKLTFCIDCAIPRDLADCKGRPSQNHLYRQYPAPEPVLSQLELARK